MKRCVWLGLFLLLAIAPGRAYAHARAQLPALQGQAALYASPEEVMRAHVVASYNGLRGEEIVRVGRAVRWLAVGLTALLAMALIWQYKAVVFAALGSPYDLRFFRVLASIAMVGLASPPLLAWLVGRRRQLPPRVS